MGETVIGGRGGQGPFEAFGAVPGSSRSWHATSYRFDEDEQENQLGESEYERTDTGNHIKVSKLK